MRGENFTFVSLSGHTDLDTQTTNKFIRSHVMRRYRRQKKKTSSPKSENSQQSAGEESSQGSYPSEDFSFATEFLAVSDTGTNSSPTETFDPESWAAFSSSEDWTSCTTTGEKDLPLTTTFPSPSYFIRTWLDGEVDPFSSLPIHMTSRLFTLLQWNASSPLRTSVHADPDGSYRRICSKDPAWLFMHLYYAARRFAQSPDAIGYEATEYLSKSQTAINESIRTSPNAVDDSTIATVTCLANIENLNGQASTARVHIGGLKRMVQIRGGLSNLGIGGILRRMVLWSDLLTSINLKIPPHFPFVATEKPFDLWECVHDPLRTPPNLITSPVLDTITTRKHSIVLSHVLATLHQLAVFLAVSDGKVLPLAACYPDRVYEVEYSIAIALYDDEVVAEIDDKVEIGRLLLQAAQLFVYSKLRQTPVGGPVRIGLISRLRELLEGLDMSYYSRMFTAEILWALLVGVSAAIGQEQDQLLEMARQVCMENQIASEAELARLLARMPDISINYYLASCLGLGVSDDNDGAAGILV